MRVQSSGFRVQGWGFRVEGSGFRVEDSGFRVQSSECGNHQVEKLAEAGIVELHDGRVHVRVHVAAQPSVSVREHLVPLRLTKPAIQTNGLADAQVPGRGVHGSWCSNVRCCGLSSCVVLQHAMMLVCIM